MQPRSAEVSGKETDTWTEASGYRDHCIHGGGDLAHVGQCTVQYSTVQGQSALSQCRAAPASTSPLRHPSYLVCIVTQ